jgi:hypothetical protein
MKKTILHYLYFFSPFFIWALIYIKEPDWFILFKRPIYETSFILPFENLWQIVLIFFVFQLSNEVLSKILTKGNIFVKINLIFIFLHLLVVSYLYFLNFL